MKRTISLYLICLALLLGWNARADNSFDKANAILGYFGANCPTKGEWTQAAIAQAGNLANVFQSILDDPDCKTMAGSLSVLNMVQDKLNSLEADPNIVLMGSLRGKEQAILLQMSTTSSASEQDQLKSQLLSIQNEIAGNQGMQAEIDAAKKQQEHAQALNRIVVGTNILVNQAIANSKCMDKNSGLLAGIGALAGSVGAVVTTGGASLGLAAGTQLMAAMVERAREHRITKKINKLAGPVIQTAYKCAIESLSYQWCAADDVEKIIELKADSIMNPTEESNLQFGVRILEKSIPSFINWLNQVRSGVDPANSSMADRQASAINREKAVRVARIQGLGVVAEAQVLFDQAVGKTEEETKRLKWTIERQMLYALYDKFSDAGPLFEIIESGYAPYFLLGLERREAPKIFGNYKDLSNFDPFSQTTDKDENWPIGKDPFVPNLNIVKTRLSEWVELARIKISQELTNVLQPDPLQLVNDAATKNANGRSPYESLQEIVSFIKKQKPKSFVVGNHEQLYNNTIERLEIILTNIKHVMEREGTTDESIDEILKHLNNIYTISSLNSGTLLIQGRIERAVRLALAEILTSNENPLDLQASSRLLAADDILADLRRFSARSDLNLISRDIMNSKTIVKNTLLNLGLFFDKSMAKSLKQSSVAVSGRSERQSLAEYCIKLGSLPIWPKHIDKSLCMGSQVTSLYSGGPVTPVFSQEFLDKPFEEKVCTYRNYLRSNYFFEEYRNRRP